MLVILNSDLIFSSCGSLGKETNKKWVFWDNHEIFGQINILNFNNKEKFKYHILVNASMIDTCKQYGNKTRIN